MTRTTLKYLTKATRSTSHLKVTKTYRTEHRTSSHNLKAPLLQSMAIIQKAPPSQRMVFVLHACCNWWFLAVLLQSKLFGGKLTSTLHCYIRLLEFVEKKCEFDRLSVFPKQRRHDWGGVLTSFLEKYFSKQRMHDWGEVLTSLLENYLCIPGFAVVAYLPRLA